MDDNKYPVLRKYLESKNKNKTDKNNYSLDNLNLFNSVLNLINEEYYNKISREDAEKRKLNDEHIYKNNKDLIDKFIDFFNYLKIKDTKLNNEQPLYHFLLDDNNKYGKAYKTIYNNFIKEQNGQLESLLEDKIDKGIFDIFCKNKINIQQINEKEIFTLNLPKKVSFIDIIFNSSYRKILDDDNRSHELYKEFVIDYNLIEENMTDLLLKNKKLLNDNITEFIYNNEAFNNQVKDIMNLFDKRYNTSNISIYDKVAIYKFWDNSKNTHLCKNIINDFITLIKHLNEKKKENNTNKEDDITEETKIYEFVLKLKDSFSGHFIKLFDNNDGLTIDKTKDIFSYYLKLIYEDLKNEIKNYQKDLEEESKKMIDDYYKNEHLITKKDFANAIRLFITLVLCLEEDKENKIMSNRNNLVNYLKSSDLWNRDIYTNDDFNKNLDELKSFKVQINQIVSLYDFLGKDIEDNFFDDVKRQLIKEEENQNSNMNNGNEPVDGKDNSVKRDEAKEPEEEIDIFAKKEDEDDNDDERD